MNLNSKYVLIILSLCVGLRLIFFGLVQPWNPQVEEEVVLVADSVEYHQLATTLIENHRFARGDDEPPDARRTPGYPLFIASIYSLFGQRPWTVLFIQSLVDTMSCFILILTIARLFDQRVALISGFFYALNPSLILFSSRLLTEVPFVFLFVLAFYLFSVGYKAESQRVALTAYGVSFALMGLATLVRPMSQFMPIFLVFFFIVVLWRQPKLAIQYSVLAVAVFLLVLSPWMGRNYINFGSYSLSTIGSAGLLGWYVGPMEESRRGQDAKTVKAALRAEVEQLAEADDIAAGQLNEERRAAYSKMLAVSYIKSNPIGFGKVYLRGIVRAFANIATSDYSRALRLSSTPLDIRSSNAAELAIKFFQEKGRNELIIAGLVVPYLLVSYFGIAAGLFVCWKRYDKGALLFSLLVAFYLVAVAAGAGLGRYTIPSIPFYLPFVGIGVIYSHERVKGRFKRLWSRRQGFYRILGQAGKSR